MRTTSVMTTGLTLHTLLEAKRRVDALAPCVHRLPRIVENAQLVIREQVRFPKSKKRRIRKKWARQARNWDARPDPAIYQLSQQGWLVMHPATAHRVRSLLQTHGEGA